MADGVAVRLKIARKSSSIDSIVNIDNRTSAAPRPVNAQGGTGTAARDRRESRDSGSQDRARRSREAPALSDELRMKIKTLERENETIREKLSSERRERRDLASNVSDLLKQKADLHHFIDAAHQREKEASNHYAHQAEELHSVKDEFRRVAALYELAQHQLEEKAAELHSAQLFINQADSLSGAEVIAMANALNAEILQGAALMADSLHRTHEPAPTSEVVTRARDVIGEDIVHALLSQTSEAELDFDPTLVQLALQVCLVKCCVDIIDCWTTAAADDRVLKAVYATILMKDKQSAAGRWRSMTKSHATHPKSVRRWLRWLTASIVDILILAGCAPQDTKTNLPDSFQEGLSMINNLAFRLRTAIGEQVTSQDIIPVAFDSGCDFNPDDMDDTYAEERRAGGKDAAAERVAGSTELGLTSRVKVAEGTQVTILLKPKVVLCSALKEDKLE
ncbi:hypothetical protein FPV67DRAFT_1676205 [Lyophyllum atratum]|nr:hypothetical protein FPV67DRAFT_1676205 [Lyophyllum atratum]